MLVLHCSNGSQLPKITFSTLAPFFGAGHIWSLSGSIRIISWQCFAKAECTTSIFSDLVGVWSFRSSVIFHMFHPLWNHPYYSNTFVCDKHASFMPFWSLKVSIAIKPLLKQNLIETHCSRCISTTAIKNKTDTKCYKSTICDATLMKFCRLLWKVFFYLLQFITYR